MWKPPIVENSSYQIGEVMIALLCKLNKTLDLFLKIEVHLSGTLIKIK